MESLKQKIGYDQPWWQPNRIDSTIALGLFVGVPVVLGTLDSLFHSKDIKGWYRTLRKPKYTPPPWLYTTVWTIIYPLMGVAAWLVFNQGGWGPHKFALSAWGLQLLLNLAWLPLALFLKKLDWALIDDILFLGVLSTTVVAFNAIDPLAATLLIPQALWVAYNTWINFQLCELNPKASSHIVDAFTVKKRVEKRVKELKAEMNDGAKND